MGRCHSPARLPSSHPNSILLVLVPHRLDGPRGNKEGKVQGWGNFLRELVRKGLGFLRCGERDVPTKMGMRGFGKSEEGLSLEYQRFPGNLSPSSPEECLIKKKRTGNFLVFNP